MKNDAPSPGSGIPYVKSGEPITADQFNALGRKLQQSQPQPGKGLRLIKTGSGFSYSTKPGGDLTFSPPFKITRAGAGKVKVKTSTILNLEANSIVPSINGVALDAEETPKLDVSNGDTIWIRAEIIPSANGPQSEIDANGQDQEIYTIDTSPAEIVLVDIRTGGISDSSGAYVNLFSGAPTTLVQYFQLGGISANGTPFNSMYGPVMLSYDIQSSYYAQFQTSFYERATLTASVAQYVPS